jgi:hypothetical protein
LVSFIRTGELGPLKLGMPMREVSELLGPPDWWMDGHDTDTTPVPLLWGYARIVEISFGCEPPHAVECIKLCQLPASGQRHLRVCRHIWIGADGISDAMRLSDLLELSIWPTGETVTVGIARSWNAVVDVCTDKVRLVWSISTDDEDLLEQRVKKGASRSEIVAWRDELSTGFFGVSSLAHPKSDRAPVEGWEDFTPSEYLDLINARPS